MISSQTWVCWCTTRIFIILEYEIGFIELSKHTPTLYSLEHEMVYRFKRGLVLPFSLTSQYLIATESSFNYVINYLRDTERACIEEYRGGSKSSCH